MRFPSRLPKRGAGQPGAQLIRLLAPRLFDFRRVFPLPFSPNCSHWFGRALVLLPSTDSRQSMQLPAVLLHRGTQRPQRAVWNRSIPSTDGQAAPEKGAAHGHRANCPLHRQRCACRDFSAAFHAQANDACPSSPALFPPPGRLLQHQRSQRLTRLTRQCRQFGECSPAFLLLPRKPRTIRHFCPQPAGGSILSPQTESFGNQKSPASAGLFVG